MNRQTKPLSLTCLRNKNRRNVVVGHCLWWILRNMHLNHRQSAAQNLLICNTQTLKFIHPSFVIAKFGYLREYEGDASE